MNPTFRFPKAISLCLLLFPLLMPAAWAEQLELGRVSKFNALTYGTAFTTGSNPTHPAPGTQFSSVGITSGGVNSGDAGDNSAGPWTAKAEYKNAQNTVTLTLTLVTGQIGNSFSNGVPRYFLGDVIKRPLTKADGTSTNDAEGYWRAMPVRPGESFTNSNNTALVDVGNAQLPNTTGASGVPLPALTSGQYESFYYSPHAGCVFASQAGAVEVWWVSSSVVDGTWKFRKEIFNVSADTQTTPVRKIYWTEGSFDAPHVRIPNGRIQLANPIYSSKFPATVPVAEVYQPPGYVENPETSAQMPDIRRTFWYEETSGVAQFSAYNREGRILVEYLGAEVAPGRFTFLGADVVEVTRSINPSIVDIDLGKQVLPAATGDQNLSAAPVLSSNIGTAYYGTTALANGQLVYSAERENSNPDLVQFYWMEAVDAGIALPAGQTPGLSIQWPKYKHSYRFIWPASPTAYAYNTVNDQGSDTTNGLMFAENNFPSIAYQDGTGGEAVFDPLTQRFVVNLASSDDKLNRTLLKFSNANGVWYQPIYTQSADRGKIQGQVYVEPDQGPPVNTTVTVGSRIERPSATYSLAGAVTSGTNYQASAYIDPYAVGVVAAEKGAIIPVNAVPGKNELSVRWFQKVEPPNANFVGFYVPSKVGKYTVSYPSELEGTWKPSYTMNAVRSQHTSTVLKDGRVLVVGGLFASSGSTISSELYDPATGIWTILPAMSVVRGGTHTATLLTSGKVLVTGGLSTGSTILSAAEIFDPVAKTWTPASAMSVARNFHNATLLGNGKVLVTGGITTANAALNTASLYDPSTNAWSSVPNMSVARNYPAATLLQDGKVMVAGGASATQIDIYDPIANTFTSSGMGTLQKVRTAPTATLLVDGRVLLCSSNTSPGTGTAEIYDPVAKTSTLVASPLVPRTFQAATLLPNGYVLITGGSSGGASNTSEFFDPVNGIWTQAGNFPVARFCHTATLLPSGEVLLAGGLSTSGQTKTTDTAAFVVNGDRLVMASNKGCVGLTAEQAAGSVYQQNDATAVGYNPNEEHAVKANNTFWALRNDLNATSGSGYTSEPFVLISYTATDGRPAMRPFRVLRESGSYSFSYPSTAGTVLQGPMPLPLLPEPLKTDGSSANTEVAGAADSAASGTAPPSYSKFTTEDRKGYKWVYRGPHASSTPTFGMQWYYRMQAGFFIPGGAQPAVGTILPFLRPLTAGVPQGNAVTGTAQTVTYTPSWPAEVPSMRIAETLTLAKFGLPDVRNQKSAEILYQQSVAIGGDLKPSVTLHDPTRYKMMALADASLTALPTTLKTAVYQGKTYFQGLPPHLQSRFFFDSLASSKGSLILKGEFHDEIAGEDYLDLNVLSATDVAALKALAVNEEAAIKAKWDSAVNGLTTLVETYEEDPSRKGTYIVSKKSSLTKTYGPTELATMPDSDTARDSYALTATGLGAGYATLMFGDGRNPALTPAGDPPVMKIIKVIPELYNGDVKVRLSSNPLDQQVSLRHSGDFAAVPENYEFEWRYSPPTNTGKPPEAYGTVSKTYLGSPSDPASRKWRQAQSPASSTLALSDYAAGTLDLPGSVTIRKSGYDPLSGRPGLMLRPFGDLDFSTTGIPSNITFSAKVGELDGFVVYVNGSSAVVHANGVKALESLVAGNAYELRLTRAATVADLPTSGSSLVVVAEIDGALRFRIFNPAGLQVFDSPESDLASQSTAITNLKSRLSSLWATTNLLTEDKIAVLQGTSAVTGQSFSQTATSGLSDSGLEKQFSVPEGVFVKGLNTIQIGLFTTADEGVNSQVDFRLDGKTRTDMVVPSGSGWTPATDTTPLTNTAIIGGSPNSTLGKPVVALGDNYFTVRYRPKSTLPAYALTGSGIWSNWTQPVLVEGWIKRVLAAINPFNQRMTDLYNNSVNTDVSLLTQAGKRWEGDVALTLDSINDFGLIEIYETVLKRGKNISINSGYDYGPANDALLLAAGYLNDLYTILGNEAYADAANPTIAIDDASGNSAINSSRFSFEGQVASSLDEELALLRGRDDFLSPQTTQAPFYNRLFWNYTRGINSGEALYATNYNIKEKVGSSTADGSINAADAQRMFPQGHGDAYGHYLTALKGYYQLLTNPNFTWTPRIEALNILGNTVAVDYKDERKFAEAASNVARTAEQIVTLSFRQQFRDDPAEGWQSFRDGKFNSSTGQKRYWGLDEWASRAGQGAYYHWAVGNAMLPDVDAAHTGIQKIDRTTVPELQLLAVSGESFQTTVDNANSHLNPLGLSPGAIAFDIDPNQLRAGKSHYEQVSERALTAQLNAKGAFDQAAKMTRLLRNQENSVDDYNTTLEEQERAFKYQLIDLYGRPYPGDRGPGRTYAQSYDGPDIANWFVVDKAPGTPAYVDAFYKDNLQEVKVYGNAVEYESLKTLNPEGKQVFSFDALNGHSNPYSVFVRRESHVQFSDEFWGGKDYGTRPQVGELQNALLQAQDSWLKLDGALGDHLVAVAKLREKGFVLSGQLSVINDSDANAEKLNKDLMGLKTSILVLDGALNILENAIGDAKEISQVLETALPMTLGLANDTTSLGRAAIEFEGFIRKVVVCCGQLILKTSKGGMELQVDKLERETAIKDLRLNAKKDVQQMLYEYVNDWRDLTNHQYGIAQLSISHQRNLQNVVDLLAKGDRILLEREIFRKRAATTVQGYRTNDLAFRAFRNESLEQYRTLFDLASRYTYLAAKSYDYETGLLGSTQGQAVISKIVGSRALGDLTGDKPQATVSTLGDSGLAGTMAQLQADFSVAKGRLGINNPDTNGTLISLRQELFRILDNPAITSDDTAWRQTLEQHMVSDLMSDPDAAAMCRNLRKSDGSKVPGIVIPFGSTIEHGKNFFGLPTAGGDHLFSASNFATKIYSVGVMFQGYVGMDPYAEFNPGAGNANTNDPNVLSATPYLYLIPVGADKMLAPPLGDTGVERSWMVKDQALPLPYNLGATAFSSNQFFSANGTLSEQPWIQRKHQAFRAVNDPAFFYGGLRSEYGSSRLVGRSVWNTQWKIVIPAYGLLNNEQTGLTRFAASVGDIKLFLRTYSNAGN